MAYAWLKIHILSFMASTLFAHILRDICYLLKYAKRVRVIKDKICILKIHDNFVLWQICHTYTKMSGYSNKSVYMLWNYTKRRGSLYSSFNSKHKNAFIWVPGHFWHMRDQTKVFIFYDSKILGDSIYLLKYAQKGRGHQR